MNNRLPFTEIATTPTRRNTQSTWTWLLMWCGKVTEGDRNQRIKLAAAPWSTAKIARRTLKHSLWLVIGLLTGLTFVGYFTPIRPLAADGSSEPAR